MHTSKLPHFLSGSGVARRFRSFLVLTVLMALLSAPARAQCTVTISNNGSSYTTSANNEVICLATPNFNKSIVINNAGCTLNIGANTFSGTLILNTTATNFTLAIGSGGAMSAALGTFRGGAINNSGTWNSDIDAVTAATTVTNNGTWTAARRFNGVAAPFTLTNASGSTWATTINSGTGASLAITNNGIWNVGLAFSPGANTFTNSPTGTATFPTLGFNGTSGQVINQGNMTFFAARTDVQSNGAITNAAGATLTTNVLSINQTASLNNAGTLQATTFFNDQGSTTNSGVLRTSVDFTVFSGTVTNTNRIIVAGAFTNNGTVAGPNAPGRGSITVAGNSNNSGNFGVSGRLDFCDAGRPTNGFDTQNGTVGAATTFCSSTPLPVTLVYFAAVRQGSSVAVRWSTASEQQNAYFEVERSAEGGDFMPLQRIVGQGTTGQLIRYEFVDAQPLNQTAYYRLRQVDVDGTETYSAVVTVTPAARTALRLLPNPARGQVQLPGYENEPVQVLDMTGRVVSTALLRQATLSLEGIRPGVYVVRVGNSTARLVVE